MPWIKLMFRRQFVVIGLCGFLFLTTACSSPNNEAPGPDQAHETNFILSHASDADADLDNCKTCHGSNLHGGNQVSSCFDCHEDSMPITLHAASYSDPTDHGADARNDLARCFGCHGTEPNRFDGGVLSDPTMFDIASANCSACHPDAGAHPTDWAGNDSSGYISSHRLTTETAKSNSCAKCHQVTSGGPQPRNDAPSCFAANFTNGNGTTTGCHAGGPSAAHDMPYDTADLHGAAAKADLAACQACHGVTGTTNFAGGSSGISCADCHTDAEAHPTRWQGSNDVTSDYASTHRDSGKQSSTCSICHDVVEGNPLPNPSAPSCFSNTFTNADGSTTGCHASGPTAAHPVPYTDPLLHGVDAKDNLTSCVPCHATPVDAGPGDNPRFNVAIGSLTAGCEDCHAANTAHPTPLWTGAAAISHKSATNMATDCALCHGTSLDGPAGGGVALACQDCHTAGSPLSLTNCTSCHNWPPDGQSPAGNQSPNRDGAHTVHNALAGVNGNCAVCHEGAGTESSAHFNGGNPASVDFASTYNAQSGAASYNSGNQTCGTTRCHGGQATPNWWSGSLTMSNDCESCHSTSSGQYNSATSGRHRKHVNDENYSCTVCHDTSKLAAEHFSDLATTGFEQNPWDTLKDSLNYSHANRRGCSVSGCHGNENW